MKLRVLKPVQHGALAQDKFVLMCTYGAPGKQSKYINQVVPNSVLEVDDEIALELLSAYKGQGLLKIADAEDVKGLSEAPKNKMIEKEEKK